MPDGKIGISPHEVRVAPQAWRVSSARGAATKLTELLPAGDMAASLRSSNLRRREKKKKRREKKDRRIAVPLVSGLEMGKVNVGVGDKK